MILDLGVLTQSPRGRVLNVESNRLGFKCLTVVFSIFVCCFHFSDTQLLINVKNQGGDVVQETILANVSEDTVILEFQRSDGTLITQLIDFTKEVQILKAVILGEEERGQSHYQVMCFVCHYQKGEFISSAAIAKLRQKNPGTVRIAEEDRGHENYTMDHYVDLKKSSSISLHIPALCAEASDATYTSLVDLELWSAQRGTEKSSPLQAVHRFPSTSTGSQEQRAISHPVVDATAARTGSDDADSANNIASCADTSNMQTACRCHLELCIGWYPCGLKYCKGRDEVNNSTISYRCGIKTCKKIFLFSYYVAKKEFCVWDE